MAVRHQLMRRSRRRSARRRYRLSKRNASALMSPGRNLKIWSEWWQISPQMIKLHSMLSLQRSLQMLIRLQIILGKSAPLRNV